MLGFLDSIVRGGYVFLIQRLFLVALCGIEFFSLHMKAYPSLLLFASKPLKRNCHSIKPVRE